MKQNVLIKYSIPEKHRKKTQKSLSVEFVLRDKKRPIEARRAFTFVEVGETELK